MEPRTLETARGDGAVGPPGAEGLDAPAAPDGASAPPGPGPATGRRGRPGPDPALAAALSALPGLGQLYTRRPGRALFFLLATVLTIGAAILLITNGERLGLWLLRDRHSGLFLLFAFLSIVVFLGLFLLGLCFWASSVIDARRTAEELRSGTPPGRVRWWFFRL